jgi:hypothetical protein
MRTPTLVFALALIAAGVRPSPDPAARQPAQDTSPWLRSESRRFEIHYQRALAPDLARVVVSAEAAYDRISRRLDFVLASKVPLVVFAPSGAMPETQVVEYATSDLVAPQQPHRSRLVLPLEAGDSQVEARLVHELTHLLMSEIILPGRGGDGGVPRWVHEGIANHVTGVWSDGDIRLMRELVTSRQVPAVSQLTGSGAFVNARANDVLGHAAFDYIESRWGPAGLRRFLNALIVPRVERTYDAVFELTPAEFDAAFREYAERRFQQPSVRQPRDSATCQSDIVSSTVVSTFCGHREGDTQMLDLLILWRGAPGWFHAAGTGRRGSSGSSVIGGTKGTVSQSASYGAATIAFEANFDTGVATVAQSTFKLDRLNTIVLDAAGAEWRVAATRRTEPALPLDGDWNLALARRSPEFVRDLRCGIRMPPPPPPPWPHVPVVTVCDRLKRR